MNDIQIFQNPEFGEIRTIEQDGEPWFVGKDVARALWTARGCAFLAAQLAKAGIFPTKQSEAEKE